jgi:PhoH-like ATPase
MNKKILVIDTSVIIQDPVGWLSAFQENDVVLHVGVLEELDNINKDRTPGRETASWCAREAVRSLNEFIGCGNIAEGIKTVGGGSLRFYTNENGWGRLPKGLTQSFDNLLLVTCLELQQKNPDTLVVLVTRDSILRMKALALKIKAEDYRRDKVESVDRLYRGFAELTICPGALSALHRSRDGVISAEPEVCGVSREVVDSLQPNACCWLHESVSNSHALALYKKTQHVFKLVHKPKPSRTGEFSPKTDEQALGLALVADQDLSLVSLIGRTGSGKTAMALLEGYRSLKEGRYNQLVIIRPTEEVGETVGFLPGSLEEKMAPRLWPIVANLAMIAGGVKGPEVGRKEVESLIESGKIQISPTNFIRGGTYDRTFLLVDEAQNLSRHSIKTTITRAGERTVVRITGDLRQVDCKFMDSSSNGLAHVIDVFPGQAFYGHLMFRTSVRSSLAEIADKLMV